MVIRQIKCNNERPVCVNCKTYGHDCSYEPISEDAKEAGRERHQRAKRRKTLGGRRPSPSSSHNRDDATNGTPETEAGAPNDGHGDVNRGQSWQASPPARPSEASVARILVSANGVSSYHGRTSALFEDHVQDRPTGGKHRPSMPDDWVERGLVAEAVRQRRFFLMQKPLLELESNAESVARPDGGAQLPPGQTRL